MPFRQYTLYESPGPHPNLIAAKHALSDNDVLIQILPNSHTMLPRERFAFGQAITAASRLHHPNVLRILDHGRTQAASNEPVNTAFIVFENADVGHLRNLPGERSWTRARAVVLSVLDVLAHAHALGVVHGHLDPTKIVFQRQREGVFTKVFGFGLKDLSKADPEFLAPERLASPRLQPSPAKDLYALGRICEEMVRNRNVNEEESYSEHPDLMDELTNWLSRMTAPLPEQRFSSVADAAIAFASLSVTKSSRTVLINAPTLAVDLPELETTPASMNPALDAMRVQPLTGQTDALLETLKAFDRAKHTQRPALAWVRASEGLGAPSVVDQVARELAGSFGTKVLFVRHDNPSPDTSGIVSAVCAALRTSADTTDSVFERIEQLGIDDPYTQAALVALCNDDNETPLVPFRFSLPSQRHAAAAAWLNAKSRDHGLVVVVHEANRSIDTLTFLRNFCSDETANPVTFLVSSTFPGVSEEADDLTQAILGLSNASTVELMTLTGAESRELLTSLGVSPSFMEPLVTLAKGEPRLLKEAAFEAASDRRIPSCIEDVFDARLEALRDFPQAEDALGLAAILGFAVDQTEWEMACDLARVDLNLCLVQRLIESRLAAYAPFGWRFENRRLHQWFLERTKASDRWQTFHHVAERMVVMRGAAFATYRAAWHAIEAERLESAQDHTISALPHLLEAGRSHEAIRLISAVLSLRRSRGVDDEKTAQLWLFRGIASLPTDPASAMWWLDRAHKRARELNHTGLCVEATTYLCLALKSMGQSDFVRLAADAAKMVLETVTPIVSAELRLAGILAQAGQVESASALLDRLENMALPPCALASHRTLRACVAFRVHAWDASLAFSISAATIAEAVGDYELLASALIYRARAEYRIGDQALAYAHFHRAAELKQRMGMPVGYAAFGLGIIATNRGNLEEARGRFDQISRPNYGQPADEARLLSDVGGLWIAALDRDIVGITDRLKKIQDLLNDVCVDARDVAMVLTFAGEDLIASSPALAKITLELAARTWEAMGDSTQAYMTRSNYSSRSKE